MPHFVPCSHRSVAQLVSLDWFHFVDCTGCFLFSLSESCANEMDEIDLCELSRRSLSPDRRIAAKLSRAAALCPAGDGPARTRTFRSS